MLCIYYMQASVYSSSYAFNNLTGLRSTTVDQTQNAIQNSKYGEYQVTNVFPENNSKDEVQFASEQPGFIMHNYGKAPFVIDDESAVLFKDTQNGRDYEKIQLFQRPFLTVPYLGRGGGDPMLESQLLQGESIENRKSVNPTMEKPYIDYSDYPLNSDLKSYINNPSNSVQELVMDGWVRGGSSARESGVQSSSSKPNVRY
jgi:hypothetical protein